MKTQYMKRTFFKAKLVETKFFETKFIKANLAKTKFILHRQKVLGNKLHRNIVCGYKVYRNKVSCGFDLTISKKGYSQACNSAQKMNYEVEKRDGGFEIVRECAGKGNLQLSYT